MSDFDKIFTLNASFDDFIMREFKLLALLQLFMFLLQCYRIILRVFVLFYIGFCGFCLFSIESFETFKLFEPF